MLDNIPLELRQLPQWVVATGLPLPDGSRNKEPLNPTTGFPARVTDKSTWGTFEQACNSGKALVGFVLSKDDPFSIIDLDEPLNKEQADRHAKIYATFKSYAELSQSGKGVHVIVKGKIPSGVRRDKVEIYSQDRYMICTGNVINQVPIADYQEVLTAMYGQMASTATGELAELPATVDDLSLWTMAKEAANGDKFLALYNGEFRDYPSQSEADFALLAMLAFYSPSNEQVRRIFRCSGLGQRPKAVKNNDYLDRALAKIRGRMEAVPMLDFSALQIKEPVATEKSSVVYPPGLVGEMAEYVFSSAIRPVREVGLSAAIALLAGIVGRCYNISATGLNQYLILLAKTGTGKEGAAGGIDALINSVREVIPSADEFLGPGTFASGQALVRVLDKHPCFVSVLGEIGLTLAQICDVNAPSHLVQLRKVLLDLFAKSGFNKWLRPSVYSDHEKNTQAVRAPNVTLLGEATPESFYVALDGTHIAEGLVPRFLVIEYLGQRPSENGMAFHRPQSQLTSSLIQYCQQAITMQANNTVCHVKIDSYATARMRDFNQLADAMINGAGNEVTAQLWNRAHLKALKLAALIAVGCDLHAPNVTKEIADWSIALVQKDVENMQAKFSSGEIGKGDHAQEADILKAMAKYPQLTSEQRLQYKVPVKLADKGNLIPYSYLTHYTKQRASFRNDRRGAITALKIVLDDMLKAGTISQIPLLQAQSVLGVSSPVYYRGESF